MQIGIAALIYWNNDKVQENNEKIMRLKGSSWKNIEPVKKHNGEGVQHTNSTHLCHKNSENIGVLCKTPPYAFIQELKSIGSWLLRDEETLDL